MPFDALPEGLLTDLARLALVRDGITNDQTWCQGTLGGRHANEHCLLGWLLVATEWNEVEATRLALDYLYPALPEQKRGGESKMAALYNFNDGARRERVVELLNRAMEIARK